VSRQESGDDATAMGRIRPPYHPLLQSWTKTATRLLELPETDGLRRALNELMPKSRVIVARRR
jgi:hypothetical protein